MGYPWIVSGIPMYGDPDDRSRGVCPWIGAGPLAGRFQLRAHLGSGGMGEVYEGFDLELSRVVAVKIAPQERARDAAWVRRFLRQAQALARIDHPGIVRVFDRGLHEGWLPFIVMEHLTGQTLAEVLRAGGAFPVELTLQLADQLADVVRAMHACAVLHRDLKPANIMLLAESETQPRVKLLDFGVAKLDSRDELTRSDELLGTLAYLAPELLEGARKASLASDLYALGSVLFELATGQRPFRERTRGELLHAIRTRPAPSAQSLNPGLPGELDALLARLLAKTPAERPDAAQLRQALACIPRAPVTGWPAPAAPPRAQLGNVLLARFELTRLLGEGRQGTVYEAYDRKEQRAVALKWLRHRGGDNLFRLKREYRTLRRLSHPNLVRIEQLFFDDEVAFLTMELLTGCEFMLLATSSHTALRCALAQVANGLCELHRHGLVHRDLKPSNLRVAADGRVVLLDLGLTVEDSAQTSVAGTRPYVAPEVFEGELTPAADMFSLGVILCEILTGQHPNGTSVREHEPDLPSDLALLCEQLLSPSPAARPSAAQVRAQLESRAQGREAGEPALPGERPAAFVGRERELALLLEALAQVAREGRARVVLVHGESGIGKTTLLEQFVRGLPATAIVLSGHCRDAERVPYPALDSAVDALSEQLLRLPPFIARALLPRDVGALAMQFPVLRRVPCIAERAPLAALPKDPLELRTRAFRVFKQLLRRISDERPLLLVVDDAQWIDPDSMALLNYCVSEPDPPALLLAVVRRTSAEARRDECDRLLEELALPTLDVPVPPLPEAACIDLLSILWTDADSRARNAQRISEQSGGHPFLLTVLAAHAQRNGPLRAPTQLDDALRARVALLSPCARAMLERVAVCTRPVPRAVFMSLSGPEAGSALGELQRERLVHRLELGGVTRLDVCHARVREALLGAIDADTRRAHHAALAEALADRDDDPEAHVEHLEAAGRAQEAADVAVRAARAACTLLAFERAASLYERARRLLGSDARDAVELLTAQASALRSAGRTHQAGLLLQEAARHAPGERAIELLRDAGRYLLLAGDIDGGLRTLSPLLQTHGIALPSGISQIVAEATERLAQLEARGLTAGVRADAEQDRLRTRLELTLSLTQALSHCDMRGIPCAFESLYLALELGDDAILQRAAAAFVICTAAHMNTRLIEPALALCRSLTREGEAYPQALLHAATAEAAHFSGQFLAAEIAFEKAERLLLESCVGATRELATVRNGAVIVQYSHKADFKTHVTRTLGWLADAEARNDLFHAAVLRVAHSIVWIAHDQPERARRELVRAESEWADADGLFEVAAVLYHDIIDRYLGDATAHLHPAQGRKHVLEGPAIQSSFLGGYVELHRAWGSLRALACGTARADEQRMAERSISAMRTLGPGIWQAVAAAFHGNLLFLRGRGEAALEQLDLSETTFRSQNMLCLAATARRRRGELMRSDFGNGLISSADRELEALGVVSPARWCGAYFSVFRAELIDELTFDASEALLE